MLSEKIKRTEIQKRQYSKHNKNINGTKTEELFKRTAHINMQINTKIEEIAYWRELASKAQQSLNEVNSGGSRKTTSWVEDCVCRIIEIEEALKSDMDRLIGLKQRVMRLIDKLDIPEYRSVLIHRYICDKTWYEIAESMGYSYVHVVNRLHPKALEKISEIESESETEIGVDG